MRTHPLSLYSSIQDAYLRYYDTAFWLRDERLRRERRGLLKEPGVIFTDPLIEPIRPYPSTVSITEACNAAGLDRAVADEIGNALFESNGDFELREHQAEALETSLSHGAERNVVVTSGTGRCRKTEAFLLPIFARLLEESKTWDSSGSLYRWWDPAQREEAWRPSRSLFKRPAAIRAVVLYPTNALVEDQIARLRAAIRRIRNRGGPDLFFGRYTGGTIGGASGTPSRSREDRVQSAAQELLAMERDLDEMVDQSEEVTSQFPDPETCGELLTRWNMIASPPDVMITNYSMLNVMSDARRRGSTDLRRRPVTRPREDPEHVFTLVVDELHSLPRDPGQRGSGRGAQPAPAAGHRAGTRRSCAAWPPPASLDPRRPGAATWRSSSAWAVRRSRSSRASRGAAEAADRSR